jgi:hypothetical protein
LKRPCKEVKSFFFNSTNSHYHILTHNLVHTACKARGQDPRIALKLEGLANAEENAKVVQVDYRSIDMGIYNVSLHRIT